MELPKFEVFKDFEVIDSHTVKFRIDVTNQNPRKIPVYAFIDDPDLKLDLDLAPQMPKITVFQHGGQNCLLCEQNKNLEFNPKPIRKRKCSMRSVDSKKSKDSESSSEHSVSPMRNLDGFESPPLEELPGFEDVLRTSDYVEEDGRLRNRETILQSVKKYFMYFSLPVCVLVMSVLLKY